MTEDLVTVGPGPLRGAVAAPPSKSLFQRAVAAASLARGTSFLEAAGPLCADARASLRAARALGARVREEPGGVRVTGRARPGSEWVDCGESGLALRMFTPLAALEAGPVTLTGSGSLLSRPVHMLPPALEALGASCETRGGYPPVRVRGPLRGGRTEVDGSLTSQVLTGLLLALPLCREDSEVRARGLRSRGYVEATLRVMEDFGVGVESDLDTGLSFIPGGQAYQPREYTVEGDWSGAAFLLVAGALAGAVTVTGLDLESPQPDRAILQALELAGAEVKAGGDSVTAAPGKPRAFSFDASGCPDLFPPLAVLAAACPGESRISGVHRLRHKESDRAAALADLLSRLGGKVRIERDAMVIPGKTLQGGTIDPHSDHRIAMAAAVAAPAAAGPVRIARASCVSKSYPRFFQDLASLGAKIS